jgi:diguanylate cyclase (GGDEF)-like protein/PAS domain S-box-containing protein
MAQASVPSNALRDVSDQLPVGLLRIDRDSRCRYLNPYWCQLTGIDREQAAGLGWLTALPAAKRAQLHAQVNTLLTGEHSVYECQLPSADNTQQLSWRWQAERDEGGKIVGAIAVCCAVSLDAGFASAGDERRYRLLFEGSGDAMLLMQGNVFIDCNQITLQMFGCNREDIIGATPTDFSPPTQADGSRSSDAERDKVHAVQMRGRQRFEWLHCRLDGNPFNAEVTLSCVTIDGEVHILAIVRDISIRKNAERELLSSYRRITWHNDVSRGLQNLVSIDAISAKALALLGDASGAHLLSFYYCDHHGDRMRCIAESGPSAGQYTRPTEFQLSNLRSVALFDEILMVDNATSALTLPESFRDRLRVRGTHALTMMPLMNGAQALGMIMLEYREAVTAAIFTAEDLAAFASTLALALKNAYHIAELDHRATHDSLTQLPNRSVLQRELTAELTNGKPLTLMLLDLDRFKEINDTLGHHIGDNLLRELGVRLQRELDTSAVLCRLGGDEFAILQRAGTLTQGLDFARTLLHTLQQTYEIDGMMLEIGASIGVAAFPEHGADYHALLRAADVAMYAAKTQAIGVAAYDPEQDANTPERLRLMAELTTAIRGGELVLHYQPKIQLRGTLAVSGFEALVRWQHPRAGLLPPGAFMPFAEVSDAIHALTLEVIRQALAQQIIWRAMGQPATIAVNLSTRNLLHAQFFDEVVALINDSGADPHLLELEITETSLMHDSNSAAAVLSKFAALGINIAVDDFGTGYSSLAYLRRLPLHALKIDRAFVQELSHNAQDQVIVRSIVALAHNLDLQVIAEGVEDMATLAHLRTLGCDSVQGFLFARPQPAAAISQWLSDFNAQCYRAQLPDNF